MRQTERYLLKIMAAALVAAVEAVAEEHQAAIRRIVVSIPDRKLILIQGDRVVKTYPIAVGAPSTPSPVGSFQVVVRVASPAWYQPGKVVPPGPDNPLGPRWIGLNQRGYGIHGTNSPGSIGGAKSHGCIRMRNADVLELFDMVEVGDVVEFHTQSAGDLQMVLAAPVGPMTER